MFEKSQNILREISNDENNSICNTCSVKNNSVLRNSSEKIIDIVSSAKKKVFFKKGQLLTKEENSSQKIYCINQGKIKIYKTDMNGNEIIIRFASAGDIIGCEMLMSKNIYDISAMAVEDSIACCIDSDVYRSVLKSEGELPLELIKFYEAELHQAEMKILKLMRLQVSGKVADALLTLYKTFRTESDARSINISLSRQDIANLAGTTKEQVSRTLSEFSDEGIIRTKGKLIEFLKPDALSKMAEV
ncbi:MAG: Crp/Fnr family transcriptional regulator [Bacteroidia bacterium]|nr:Crp/Fnr family transcriptional regulator [Bacteroidia bacterium]